MSECVIGAKTFGSGYAYVVVERQPVLAHRVVWEAAHGPIPKGHQVHHACRNKACVNLEHLELVTSKEHGIRHRQCDHDDRYVSPDGYSQCRVCRAERQRERRQRDPERQRKYAHDRWLRIKADPVRHETRKARRRANGKRMVD